MDPKLSSSQVSFCNVFYLFKSLTVKLISNTVLVPIAVPITITVVPITINWKTRKLEAALPDCKLVDISVATSNQRMVKSKEEIEVFIIHH